MKIYIIPIDEKYYTLPKINPFCPHSFGYNCELDFHNFILKYPHLTDDPGEADWHYLPLYWSYWQLSHDYGRNGRKEMAEYLKKIVTNPEKTFTISEADNEPTFGVNMKVFSGNTDEYGWIPIPILTKPHDIWGMPIKKYITNFVGTIEPWKERIEMAKLLSDKPGVKIIRNKKGEGLFVETILNSYTTLCPRGSAMGSYRFYESMQLGTIPIMISERDFRPFKDKIEWDEFSYFVDSPAKLPDLIDTLNLFDPDILEQKGNIASKVWESLYHQGWCKYVMDYLTL